MLTAITALPVFFPRLRPANEALERWAEAPAGRATDGVLDEGLALVGDAERRRITADAAAEKFLSWNKTCRQFGADVAEAALLRGGVAVAAAECRELHAGALDLVERTPDADAATLALVLHAQDLWSGAEVERVEAALDDFPDDLDDDEYERRWEALFPHTARRFWSPAHEARLDILVRRVRRRLPADGFPRASEVLRAACKRVAQDRRFRQEVGVELLVDAVYELRRPAWPLAA
jgi:hypothetical protein